MVDQSLKDEHAYILGRRSFCNVVHLCQMKRPIISVPPSSHHLHKIRVLGSHCWWKIHNLALTLSTLLHLFQPEIIETSLIFRILNHQPITQSAMNSYQFIKTLMIARTRLGVLGMVSDPLITFILNFKSNYLILTGSGNSLQ